MSALKREDQLLAVLRWYADAANYNHTTRDFDDGRGPVGLAPAVAGDRGARAREALAMVAEAQR